MYVVHLYTLALLETAPAKRDFMLLGSMPAKIADSCVVLRKGDTEVSQGSSELLRREFSGESELVCDVSQKAEKRPSKAGRDSAPRSFH